MQSTQYIEFGDTVLCVDWYRGEPQITTLNGREFFNLDLVRDLLNGEYAS